MRHNSHVDRLCDLVGMYGCQQLADGLDPSTVGNNIKLLRSLGLPRRNQEFLSAEDKLYVQAFLRDLVRKKNSVGTRHKTLYPLSQLRHVYSTPTTSVHELKYQLMWYLLTVTGQRAGNLADATFQSIDGGLRVHFNEGRKNDAQKARSGIIFLYEWTESPPAHLIVVMQGVFKCPQVGTKANIAANINSWLRKMGHPFTSGCPRVHLDNVLRRLHELNLMTTEQFEHIMDHNLSTSDKHYYEA